MLRFHFFLAKLRNLRQDLHNFGLLRSEKRSIKSALSLMLLILYWSKSLSFQSLIKGTDRKFSRDVA